MTEFDPLLATGNTPVIPSKCEGCGVQCELAAELAGLTFVKLGLEQFGLKTMDDEFESEVSDMVPPEELEGFTTFVRNMTGRSIEEIDEQMGSVRTEMGRNADVCDGSFKMRATKKGITYTTTVCTSSRVYAQQPNNRAHLPSHVEAKPEQK